MRWIVLLLCCASAPAWAWQSKRLYVESFTTKAGSEKLRSETIAELRKLGRVSVVENESGADAILAGGGEIWVKGYRSLNPRSGRLPENGTPVYTGYLSVELRDRQGETTWSYLVTPGADAGDVSRELAKRIARLVGEAIEQQPFTAKGADPVDRTTLHGAGATFPYPVYAKWFTNFHRANPGVEIVYDAIGSQAGIRRLVAGELDFGASDSPEVFREVAPDAEGRFLFFPSVVGAVVPIVNLPGFAGTIHFTAEALAGIYLGKIKKWNDPVLAQANRGVHLPDLDIVVVHRADGSGTSYAWTDYLSKANPEWKSLVGSGLRPGWPVGRGANGNEGVAQLVKEIGGAIGYVEFIYALQNHLSYGQVRNRSGEFVGASLESMAVAMRETPRMSDDFKVSIVDSPGAGAYPIVSFTWLVAPVRIADDAKRGVMTAFLKWMLGPGQLQAAALGYLALPQDVVHKELPAIDRISLGDRLGQITPSQLR